MHLGIIYHNYIVIKVILLLSLLGNWMLNPSGPHRHVTPVPSTCRILAVA